MTMPLSLLDTNVLVHAAYKASPLYEAAARLVDAGLSQARRFCISPQNLVEFAAVASRPRFVNPPLSAREILRMVTLLFASRRLAKIYPKRATVIRAITQGSALGIQGPRWYDLFLSATMRDNCVARIITDDAKGFIEIPLVTPITIEAAAKDLL